MNKLFKQMHTLICVTDLCLARKLSNFSLLTWSSRPTLSLNSLSSSSSNSSAMSSILLITYVFSSKTTFDKSFSFISVSAFSRHCKLEGKLLFTANINQSVVFIVYGLFNAGHEYIDSCDIFSSKKKKQLKNQNISCFGPYVFFIALSIGM